ncbi:SBBP repeat-containing protein [Sphingomonas sp. S2-65]|uniref:SBBP repeat-containing protein n=1 Tax=Sphingomonas sp. S2-65 TaxID=2903960 RepID=UPI001F1EEF08|nr:SBBP repeat-containing protein [Sphingomonas sp. S2-65]UYY59683.1 SBBP repeat-containing protein [Sphingomonas sp. S2-65]
MSVNLSGSLVGLSLLTGSNSFSSFSPISYDSKAVRTAKALFTQVATTPPWKDPASSRSPSTQLSAILASRTIIEKSSADSLGTLLTGDVATSFTAYKALDKLRVLAEAATAKTASDALRGQYEKAFAKGLADLQGYLTSAPSDQVNLSFGKNATTANSTKLAAAKPYETVGKGIVKQRSDAVPGLAGQEQFKISIARGTQNETFTVDLSQGTQPPTINSVVDQLNSAIKASIIYNPDGTPMTDADGEVETRWSAHFEAEKNADGKWAIALKTPLSTEKVSMEQVGAKDSLVIATGQTPLDAPTAARVFRLNDPAGDSTQVAMSTISALDRQKTQQNVLAGKTTTITTATKDSNGKVTTTETKTSNAYASTDAAAVATDSQGNSYVVGTTSGDLGANLSDGDNNLYLTKMDSTGKVVWQRSLGAGGSSTGAAVSVGADGSIAVAGSVTGSFDGINSADANMVVAKYAANGDEQFSTVIRSAGADAAKAVAVGADGSVYVGGRSAANGGDAFVARIDAGGKIADRRTIAAAGADSINALAIGKDGNVLAVMSQSGKASVLKLDAQALSTSLGSISLGTADVRAIAVADDGSIAVGGAASAALSGTQVNGKSEGRDGFVARIDGALGSASVTYLGTAADDQVDSIAFLNGDLYAGGRTTGDLAAKRVGSTDGFVARIDIDTGTIASTKQFGQSLIRTEPVRIAADVGGGSALSALGLPRGTINATASEKVTTQTTLHPGDYFSIRADDGALRRVEIQAGDTLKSIATRMQGVVGASKGTVTAVTVNGTQQLRIAMKAGHELELIAGSADQDALAKLGIDPQRIAKQATVSSDAPKVRPGGNFGLDLSAALNLSTLDSAKVALGKITSAISMSQTAYRSLYWDDAKATMVDGVKKPITGGGSTSRENAQLANYQAALDRLSSNTSSTIGF